MADRIEVAFAGESAPPTRLTWGQRHIWDAMIASNSPMNMCAVRTLGAETDPADVAAELRFYLERFEAMRTVLRLDPAGGAPTQVVLGAGVTGIEIADVADDPGSAATAIAAAQEATHFDVEREVPIRVILIRCGGAFTHLVTTLSHLAADASGGLAMYLDYIRGAADPVAMQPRELAVRQTEPSARRQSDASLAYWGRHLRSIPMRRFPVRPTGDGPHFWEIRAASPMLHVAVAAIARRLRIDTGTVLFTLWAAVLARVTGSNPTVIQILVSNRFRPGLADIVSNIFQAGLVVVDLAGCTFDEAVARTRRAANGAAKHAYYDCEQWHRLAAEIEAERGGNVDLSSFYNDRPAPRSASERPITPEDIAGAARGEPTFVAVSQPHDGIIVNVTEQDDAYVLAIRGSIPCLRRDEAASLVTLMEDLAARAAADGACVASH